MSHKLFNLLLYYRLVRFTLYGECACIIYSEEKFYLHRKLPKLQWLGHLCRYLKYYQELIYFKLFTFRFWSLLCRLCLKKLHRLCAIAWLYYRFLCRPLGVQSSIIGVNFIGLIHCCSFKKKNFFFFLLYLYIFFLLLLLIILSLQKIKWKKI